MPSCLSSFKIFYISSEAEALLDAFHLLEAGFGATLVAAFALHGVLHLDVELDLRLSAGRTDADLGAIVAEPLQHVALVGHVDRRLASVGVGLLQFEEVLADHHLAATEVGGWVVAEVGHHLLDFVGTCLAGTHHVDGDFLGEAILEVDVHEEVVECLAVVLRPSGNLADEADGCW